MEVNVISNHAEIGILPQDWRVEALGRLIASVEYGSSAKSAASGDIPVLRMGNLQDGQIDWNDLVFTSNDSEIRKYALKPGDVLFNRTNTIELVGKTSIYRGERPAIFAGYLIRVSVNKSVLDSRFLNFVLNAEFSRKHSLKVLSLAVGQANINGQKLQAYPIPIPPTTIEQQAIAEALSDADALIESIEQLIAKKRLLKQAAMQELLTGKKRLPGFAINAEDLSRTSAAEPPGWNVRQLGSFASIAAGGTPSRVVKEYWDGNIPWVTTAEINFSTITSTAQHISESGLKNSAAKLLDVGTLLVALYGQGKTRGSVSILGIQACTNQACASIVLPSSVSHRFVFHSLVSQYESIRDLSNSGSQANLNGHIIKSLPILMPVTKAEQTAIAAVLDDLDTEIATLEAKLTKARQIKQGMMQNLLTGRIRLV